jgi:hypothetical protein
VAPISRRVTRWVRWPVLVVLGAVAASCAGRSVDQKPVSCATDDDCAAGLSCVKAVDKPVIGIVPCDGHNGCSAGSHCATGEICAPSWQVAPLGYGCPPTVCGQPCTVTGCPKDSSCDEKGYCAVSRCDETGASPCPALWRCDPSAAAAESPYAFVGVSQFDGINVDFAHARGCARKRCDEPGGYTCAELYVCESGVADNAGCTPGSCEDTGRCVTDDGSYICANESRHVTALNPPDQFGCVVRGCDEGAECSWYTADGKNVGFCDYLAPRANPVTGCAAPTCRASADCAAAEFTCDPEHVNAERDGCRYKDCLIFGNCPAGTICSPQQTDAVDGCAPDGTSNGGGGGTQPTTGGTTGIPEPAGGAGGAGGTSSTGGSGAVPGAGTGGMGGTTPKPMKNGECKPR